MDTRIELIICLGSSCFSRGNKKILALIQEYIHKNGLENKVNFHGNRCFDNCARGPVLRIGNQSYYEVGEANVEELLDEAFRVKERNT
jgi:NADH:ubiquinone oxidoreductase subunit E